MKVRTDLDTMSRSMPASALALVLTLCGMTAPVFAQSGDEGRGNESKDQPFSASYVQELARNLARKAFVPPKEHVRGPWSKIGYDQYRDIRFRSERAIWRGERRNFELHLLPAAWLYKMPVDINIVSNGEVHPLRPDNGVFDFGKLARPPDAGTEPIGFSGFRINAPVNRRRVFDEIWVFQGASYFRGVSRGQIYGLSARGLAINTAQPSGEEFPFFRTFWIETPTRSARRIVVHALLDSPSATGAYKFTIQGGAPTTADVDVTLFLRRDSLHVGLAPLTSMFLFSGIDRSRVSDFRPAVHDSDGLAIADTEGERVWRPLTNPKRLQVSSFSVTDLRGFGLVQRARNFFHFQDLEASYERRPSAWIEPTGSWGGGSVELIEIPSDEEIHDNVVAFWRPHDAYSKDQVYRFGYRISWPDDVRSKDLAIVRSTSSGLTNGPERKSGAIRYSVEFVGGSVAKLRDPPGAALSATAGRISKPVVQRNPYTKGWRVHFLFTPGDGDLAELRLELKDRDKTISEVWLSRWTR
jgi:periplasmic glucans biosynthesis protein